MFEIGWSEMLVIAIVLIVVVGPKDLPKMLRSFGRTTAKLRVMAGDFRKQFDEALKEAELDDVKDIVKDVRKLDPTSEVRKALNPMESAAKDVRAGLDSAFKPPKMSPQAAKPSAQPAPPPAPPPSKPVAAAPLKAGATAIAGETAARPAARAKPKPAGTAATKRPSATKGAKTTKDAAPKKPAPKTAAKGKPK